MLLALLAQTFTASAPHEGIGLRTQILLGISSLLAIVGFAIVRAAPVLVDQILAGIRARLARWVAKSQLEELQMARDLERLRAEAEAKRAREAEAQADESKRVATVAVHGVELATLKLESVGRKAEAKETKDAITALSDDLGVKNALGAIVEGEGFSTKKTTQPERPVAPAQDNP